MKRFFSTYIFLLLYLNLTIAQSIKLNTTNPAPANITSNIKIFEDPTAQLSLDQVKNKNFVKYNKKNFLFPFTNSTFWVHFTIKNVDFHTDNLLLEWKNPLVEQLDFYISDSTKSDFIHQKEQILTTQKKFKNIDESIVFKFQLQKGQEKEVFIKLSSKRGHFGALILHTKESYNQSFMKNISSQSFMNGMLIFRLFLVLTLSFFVIKEIPFRLYSLHVVVKTLGFFGFVNIIAPYLTDSPDLAKRIDFLFYNSVTIGAGIFLLYTIQQHQLPRIFKFITLFFLTATFFENIIVFFDYQWYWLKAGIYTIVFSSIYFLSVYIFCLIKGITTTRYYAVMFILGMISPAILYSRLLGWIEFQPVYTIAYIIFMVEIFIIYFFIGRIFRSAEQNKVQVEQKLNFNIEQNKKLIELDQMKTNFFANISHEFRTPLTLILGPIEDITKKEPTNETFRMIERNARRLLQLINQILDLSKLESHQMKINASKVDLVIFFRTLMSSYSSLAASRNILFKWHQNENEIFGTIDKDKVEKITNNLLSNAFKFTESGKCIQVNVEYNVELQIFSITVKDEGIGMEKNQIEKIFNRFYQIDDAYNRQYEGSGIGLSLVKELVEFMKGSILVESEIGVGTSFIVKLPLNINTDTMQDTVDHDNESIQIQPDEVSQNQDHKKMENAQVLLIIDDNADIRSYIRNVFESEYQVLEAENGIEGIDKAQEKIPNIIICDLMMPEMDGFEFCKSMKNNKLTSHIPIILLTAKANIESRIEGLELGADDYLVKPFHTDEIKVRVKNLLEKQQKLQTYYSNKIFEIKPDIVKVPSIEEAFILRVKEIIEDNLSDSRFGVETFSIEIGMSQSQLLRKIKAVSNKTVVEFIRDYRLQRAEQLIKQKSGTISEIAFKVGFENNSYFTKVFQEKFGKLPSEY